MKELILCHDWLTIGCWQYLPHALGWEKRKVSVIDHASIFSRVLSEDKVIAQGQTLGGHLLQAGSCLWSQISQEIVYLKYCPKICMHVTIKNEKKKLCFRSIQRLSRGRCNVYRNKQVVKTCKYLSFKVQREHRNRFIEMCWTHWDRICVECF